MRKKLHIVSNNSADQGVQRSSVHQSEFQGRAAIITLGCAKNQVDSEVMLGVLESRGFELVDELDRADVAVINTCGFLESAVQESIDRILDAADYKQSGRLRKLIVSGCIVERFKGELSKELPEVDAFLGTDDLLSIADVVGGQALNDLDQAGRPYLLFDDSVPRNIPAGSPYAYIKIAEGCNRPCTFCIIPKIRGAARSRKLDSVVREAERLSCSGIREVNLIAQDLTSYGKDLQGPGLAELLRRLDSEQVIDWVRLLYAYPIGIDEDLIRAISDSPRICNYLDLPLQHSSEKVLRQMKRPLGRYAPRDIVNFIHDLAPEIAMRTTFIVGFPGESEEDIADLEAFVSEGYFDSVGVFTYSPESGTPAALLSGQVDSVERELRRERIMLAQRKVLEKKLETYVGTQQQVLVEGAHKDSDLLLSGRTRFQAPEVDGVVIINDIAPAVESAVQPGVIAGVEITGVAGYDLIGRLVSC